MGEQRIYKLPVWQTIKGAYGFIWAEKRAWLTYGSGPAIFVSLLALATFTFVTVQFGIAPLPKGLQFTP